jgi:hypothetical protein
LSPGPGWAGTAAVLGVSYKPGVGDIRESPALKILTLLKGLGAELRYHDPHVPALRDHGLQSVSLDDALEHADLALIVTAHPQVDHQLVAERAPARGPAGGHARAGGRRGGAAVGDPRAQSPEEGICRPGELTRACGRARESSQGVVNQQMPDHCVAGIGCPPALRPRVPSRRCVACSTVPSAV